MKTLLTFLIDFQNLDNSIIRRVAGLLLLVIPAFVLNFLFLILSKQILDIKGFGIFYTALSIVNIFHAPSVVSNLFFSKNITTALSSGGYISAKEQYLAYIRFIVKVGGSICISLVGLMFVFGNLIAVESLLLIVLIPVTIFSTYLFESLRAFFQGVKKFKLFGCVTFAWSIARLLLGIGGFIIVGLVWSGLLGIAIGGFLIFIAGYVYIIYPDFRLLKLKKPKAKYHSNLFLFSLSYGVFILLMYLDILTAYLTLGRLELGLYSSFCILSKSIILFSNPVINVFFPVVVEQKINKKIDKKSVNKTFFISFLMSFGPVLLISFFSEPVSTHLLDLKSTNLWALRGVVASAVPVCLIRVLVVLQLARGYDKHALLLIPAIILQFILLYLSDFCLEYFSWSFVILCWFVLFYYSILCFKTTQLKIADMFINFITFKFIRSNY